MHALPRLVRVMRSIGALSPSPLLPFAMLPRLEADGAPHAVCLCQADLCLDDHTRKWSLCPDLQHCHHLPPKSPASYGPAREVHNRPLWIVIGSVEDQAVRPADASIRRCQEVSAA